MSRSVSVFFFFFLTLMRVMDGLFCVPPLLVGVPVSRESFAFASIAIFIYFCVVPSQRGVMSASPGVLSIRHILCSRSFYPSLRGDRRGGDGCPSI